MSIYVGCKDCLVVSYDGNVRVNNVPQNTRRSKVVEVVREVLQERFNKPLTGLNNIEYYKDSEIYNFIEEKFNGDVPEDFYISVDWDNYK